MNISETTSAPVRILDPIDRISEILFGLFMALTFTGTLSVVTAGTNEVRTMMIAAIGCNVAWGLVDGVMFALRSLVTRGRQIDLLHSVKKAKSTEEAYALINAGTISVTGDLSTQELAHLHKRIIELPHHPAKVRLGRVELLGALGVFMLVVASTFPVIIPFIFISDLHLAKRLSHVIAISMLYLCGHAWGRYAGMQPILIGTVMVAVGALITAVIIALGG